jgi:hypothetical protein
MRIAFAVFATGLASCFASGADPSEDPCSGSNPGLRIVPRPSPDGEDCSPGAFQRVTITVSSLGTADAIHDYLPGAADHALPWPVGTFPDVPGEVRYEGRYDDREGIGQAGIITAPTECLPVDVVLVCRTSPLDAGP